MEPMYLYYFTREERTPLFIQYGFHNEDMELHTHADFFELVIVMHGSATHIVNEEQYQIQKGDVFVLGNDIAHGYINPKEFRICNVMFQPEVIFQNDYDIKKSYGYHALFVIEPHISKEHRFQSRLKLSVPGYEQIHSIIASMVEVLEQKNCGYKTLLLSGFLQMVVLLCNEYELSPETSADSLLTLALAVSYIETHYKEAISMDTLAGLTGFSVRHFTRLFRQTYHTSPLQYILNARIRSACSLLLNTALPVSQIAFLCGFEDSNYFSRQFKQNTGLSPVQYRDVTIHRN